MCVERQHAHAIQKGEVYEQQEKGSRYIAVDAATAPRVQPTRPAIGCPVSRSMTGWPGSGDREPSRTNRTRNSRPASAAATRHSPRTRGSRCTRRSASFPSIDARSSGRSAHMS
jgi:hypothetical protein